MRVALPATIALLLAIPAGTARATTCSSYSTQAAAQAAGDTRDADGDGIYCESLPCPCSTARPGGGGRPLVHAPNVPKGSDPQRFRNCAALRVRYRHGVARSGGRDRTSSGRRAVTGYLVSTTVYDKNRGLDRDNDGVACEKA